MFLQSFHSFMPPAALPIPDFRQTYSTLGSRLRWFEYRLSENLPIIVDAGWVFEIPCQFIWALLLLWLVEMDSLEIGAGLVAWSAKCLILNRDRPISIRDAHHQVWEAHAIHCCLLVCTQHPFLEEWALILKSPQSQPCWSKHDPYYAYMDQSASRSPTTIETLKPQPPFSTGDRFPLISFAGRSNESCILVASKQFC